MKIEIIGWKRDKNDNKMLKRGSVLVRVLETTHPDDLFTPPVMQKIAAAREDVWEKIYEKVLNLKFVSKFVSLITINKLQIILQKIYK